MPISTIRLWFCLLVLASAPTASVAAEPAPRGGQDPRAAARLRVFLDCDSCFQDYLRTELQFVEFVRDRTEGDVHALITSSETGSGGREYAIELVGQGRFAGFNQALKAVTGQLDPEDQRRRAVASTLTVGLLNYLARAGLPESLDLRVRLRTERAAESAASDPWNNWVFSIRGSAGLEAQETSREVNWDASVGADRVTDNWIMTVGASMDQRSERFNLDRATPLRTTRRERDLQWTVVKSLGEHWSAGTVGRLEASTFDNTSFSFSAGPAIEFNVFPYSMYTRRQLRIMYSLTGERARYFEETLFGKLEETLARHELSTTLDQRERWGSLQARVEWSQYLHDLGKYRLEVDGELSVRIARGLSVQFDANASRIRDQIGLPRRGATEEEVLLRLRRLLSGYEYTMSAGFTYTFGSIFNSIVNPRFGQ